MSSDTMEKIAKCKKAIREVEDSMDWALRTRAKALAIGETEIADALTGIADRMKERADQIRSDMYAHYCNLEGPDLPDWSTKAGA